MNKRKEEKKWKKKKDQYWASMIKLDYDNKCAVCGKTERLNAHHILPREFLKTRWDRMNGIALCPGCHKFCMKSAHKNGFWFVKWLNENEPEKTEYLWSVIKNE